MIAICLDKLIRSCGFVQDTNKKSKGKHGLFVKITRLKNFYHICYDPNYHIQTYWEAIFSFTKKIKKNRVSSKVINKKGNTNFPWYCLKHLPLFPKAYFCLNNSLQNPPWVRELLPFSDMYKLKNSPLSWKVTFAKIYLGDYLHYPKGILPLWCVEIETKQLNGKFCILSY